MQDLRKIQKLRVASVFSSVLNKGEENDLEKSGEGSRGGKIIGHTSTGKPIYDVANHASHSNFSSQDHLDASFLHRERGELQQKLKHEELYYKKQEEERPTDKESFSIKHHEYGKLPEHIQKVLEKKDTEHIHNQINKLSDNYKSKTKDDYSDSPGNDNLDTRIEKQLGKDHYNQINKLQDYISSKLKEKGWHHEIGQGDNNTISFNKNTNIKKSEETNLEKAGHGHIGEIRDWGGKKYKKQPNGKWLQVSESHGLTKKEHEDRSTDFDKRHEMYGGYKQMSNEEKRVSSNLSDKEHDESELDDKVKISEGDTVTYKKQKLRVASVFGETTPNGLEKAGHGHIGETRDWGGKKYKKQPNGKWLQVSESYGMTRKEYETQAKSGSRQARKDFMDGVEEKDTNIPYEELQSRIDKLNQLNEIHYNLSDKEHDESELDDKVKISEGDTVTYKKQRCKVVERPTNTTMTLINLDEDDNEVGNQFDLSVEQINGVVKESEEDKPYSNAPENYSSFSDDALKREFEEKTGEDSEDFTREELVKRLNKSMSLSSTPGFETVTEHGKIVDMKKSEDELITFLKTIPTIEEQEMLTKSHNGLTAKKVTVHRKDGTPYIAVRWVNEHGESPTIEHPKYKKESEYEGNDDSEKVSNIVNSNSKPIEKQRALIALGIRDKQTLDHLSGTHYNDSQHYLKNEAKIEDWKEYSVNDMLPSSPSGDGVEISSPSILNSVVSDIQSKLGDKKAFELQQQLKEELIKKYNVTVEDKWDGYGENLSLLLDGELGLRSVMGYGTGGVGKTFAFEKLAQERGMNEYDAELDMEMGGDEYDYIKIGGKIGSKEMQRAMFYHRNKLLVFDDCDSMWDDEGLINVLKNTLDTSGKGKTQWAQRLPGQNGEEDVPSVFTFTGQMIFITNKTKKELVEAGAGPIVESRAASSDLSMNMVQTLERLEKILPGVTLKDTNREPMADVTEEDKQQALTALKSVAQYARVEQLNTRVITGLIAKARYQRKRKGGYNANDLSKIALQQFGIL